MASPPSGRGLNGGSVDPGRRRQGPRLGGPLHEAFGMSLVGGEQGLGAHRLKPLGLTVMDRLRRHQGNAGVPMSLVIPGEESPAELPGVLDRTEAAGETWAIFQRLEGSLRVGVVVRLTG
jgi:hypothetical protein